MINVFYQCAFLGLIHKFECSFNARIWNMLPLQSAQQETIFLFKYKCKYSSFIEWTLKTESCDMFIYVKQCVRPEELRNQNLIVIRFDC